MLLAALLSLLFDRGGSGALPKVDVQDCKQGRAGMGHVTATFQPDGTVSRVVIDAGPFEERDPVGKCIVERFLRVRVQPFQGDPVRVGKSFVIN